MTEEIKQTSKIQWQSLNNFAKALGYEYWSFDHSFFSTLPENKHRHCVSVNTMIKWHNGKFLETHGKKYNWPWEVSSYQFNLAQASKIVWAVKLQYAKKHKLIKTQSNLVAFMYPSYEQEFLGVSDD